MTLEFADRGDPQGGGQRRSGSIKQFFWKPPSADSSMTRFLQEGSKWVKTAQQCCAISPGADKSGQTRTACSLRIPFSFAERGINGRVAEGSAPPAADEQVHVRADCRKRIAR